jgi:multidrug efflux pump
MMTGRSVPLKQVADLEIQWQPSKILRRSRLKTVTVQSEVSPGTLPIALSQELEKYLREENQSWDI